MAGGETEKEIVLERSDGWLTIRFNRPQARNALTASMIGEISAALDEAADDAGVRGVTLRGNGGVFCAGGDIKGFGATLSGDADARAALVEASREAGRFFRKVDETPMVVVALVEGAAMAGGLGLACAADFVASAGNAGFALGEVLLGIPPAQIAPVVVARTGAAAARRIMLTGRRFDAEEAFRLGIVDHVADDVAGLESYEAGIRESVLKASPGAVAATKEMIRACRALDALSYIELAGERFADCLTGEEGREGVAAFIGRRKPRWAP